MPNTMTFNQLVSVGGYGERFFSRYQPILTGYSSILIQSRTERVNDRYTEGADGYDVRLETIESENEQRLSEGYYEVKSFFDSSIIRYGVTNTDLSIPFELFENQWRIEGQPDRPGWLFKMIHPERYNRWRMREEEANPSCSNTRAMRPGILAYLFFAEKNDQVLNRINLQDEVYHIKLEKSTSFCPKESCLFSLSKAPDVAR